MCLCRFQFASYCCGWLHIIFIEGFFFGSDSFFDYTRLCVTSDGFTHDKSVSYLFSTPQARSQQQTEILIHLLKKLAPINDIRGVSYLVDQKWTICRYFLHAYGKNSSYRAAAHAPTKYQSNSTSGRGARASYRTMLPEISARRSLLEPSRRLSYLSSRDMPAARPRC